jgi:hypothetical protein
MERMVKFPSRVSEIQKSYEQHFCDENHNRQISEGSRRIHLLVLEGFRKASEPVNKV